MASRITNENGQFRSATGPDAVNAFRLKVMIAALKFHAKTGMQMTRGVSILTLAKRETGLRTNDHGKLIAALEHQMTDALELCEIVTDGAVAAPAVLANVANDRR